MSTLVIRSVKVANLGLPPVPLRTDARVSGHAIRGIQFLTSTNFQRIILTHRLSLHRVDGVRRTYPSMPLRVFIRKTLYIDCDKRYCIDRTYFKHDTGQNRYTRFYHLPFDLISTRKQIVIGSGRLLSLGSLGRDSRLRTLLSTNTSSFGVRKQLGSISCMGGIATTCHQGLSTVFTHHGRCTHTSSKDYHCTFGPRLSGDFDQNFARCCLRKHAGSIFSFSAPGSLNRRVNAVGRTEKGCLAMTKLGSFGGNSKIYCVSRRNELRNFHVGQIRNGGLCPRRVPHVGPHAILCQGFSRRFRGVLTHGSSRHEVTISIQLASAPFKFTLALASRSSGDMALSLTHRGRPTHAPRRRGLGARLTGFNGAPFRTMHVSVSFTKG